jgi:hypothetical protein
MINMPEVLFETATSAGALPESTCAERLGIMNSTRSPACPPLEFTRLPAIMLGGPSSWAGRLLAGVIPHITPPGSREAENPTLQNTKSGASGYHLLLFNRLLRASRAGCKPDLQKS